MRLLPRIFKIFVIFSLNTLLFAFNSLYSQPNELWWVNAGGGTGNGTVSKVNTDGSNYADLYKFSSSDGTSAFNTYLTKAQNGKVYGVTAAGGQYNNGVLFEINSITGAYTKKYDFDTTNNIGGTIFHPLVSYRFDNTSSAKLYGVTSSGGAAGLGSFFEFNPTTGIVTKLFDKTIEKNVLSFLLSVSGKFYGIAGLGVNNLSVFEYDLSTSTYTNKLSLPTIGVIPTAFMQYTNGKLYTVEQFSAGSVYEYDINLNKLTKRANLSDLNICVDYANTDYRTLTGAGNGKLYGVASTCPSSTGPPVSAAGVLYEFDPGTGALAAKKLFDYSVTGGSPRGSLSLFSNGKLYGSNYISGQNAVGGVGGTIYEYNPSTNNFVVIQHLPALANGGNSPKGNIIEIIPSTAPAIVNISDITVEEHAVFAYVNVCLSAASNQPVTVSYDVSHGSATIGKDYFSNKGTITIPSGQICAPFPILVSIIDDNLIEATEEIVMQISNPINATIGDEYGVISIIDNDNNPPPTSVLITDARVSESARFATLSVVAFDTPRVPITINYRISGGKAVAGQDFLNPESFTIVLQPGQLFANINVPLLNDGEIESTEDIVFNIMSATNARISDAYGAISIFDDDNGVALPVIKITPVIKSQNIAGQTANSEKSIFVEFSTIDDKPVEENVRFSFYLRDNTAKIGLDYQNTTVNTDLRNRSIANIDIYKGYSRGSQTIPLVDDTLVEGDESFFIQLVNPFNAVLTQDSSLLIITDNDAIAPPPSSPIVSINDVNVSETSKFGTLFVSIPSAQSIPVTVQYKVSGGIAVSGSDYISSSGTVTIAPGKTFAPIKIQLINDSNIEPTEDIVVNISNPVNAVLGDAYGAINILDDESSGTLPVINIKPVIKSSDIGPGFGSLIHEYILAIEYFTSDLQPVKEDVRIPFYLWDGTAKAGLDYYAARAKEITIPKGSNRASIGLFLNDDELVEGDEFFTIRFTNLTNATLTQDSTRLIITDNDFACLSGSTCITNKCPSRVVRLDTAYSISGLPTGTAVSYHFGNPATDANKMSPAFVASGMGNPGVYYAAVNISGSNCYSATVPIVVNIDSCFTSPNIPVAEPQTNNSTYPSIIKETKSLSISPNPFVNNIQASVQMEKHDKAVLTVLDIFGRQIKSKTVQLSAGKNQVYIDGLGKLPAGSYLLRISSGSTVETHKIIKQE
jgi:uncharacterized repeat protein (TIGR03803 family)